MHLIVGFEGFYLFITCMADSRMYSYGIHQHSFGNTDLGFANNSYTVVDSLLQDGNSLYQLTTFPKTMFIRIFCLFDSYTSQFISFLNLYLADVTCLLWPGVYFTNLCNLRLLLRRCLFKEGFYQWRKQFEVIGDIEQNTNIFMVLQPLGSDEHIRLGQLSSSHI